MTNPDQFPQQQPQPITVEKWAASVQQTNGREPTMSTMPLLPLAQSQDPRGPSSDHPAQNA
ncbi:hypothetical protein [Raineyella sp.]|uniref:hypothetical protein n=1 Tax=Raineyella sp. TaxID=1911550 RepID=UPI002B1F2F9F|nr:hypothetical protein [Raineyella sp.]MEA5154448.1 hypothetical protein [Raineyella sp.]